MDLLANACVTNEIRQTGWGVYTGGKGPAIDLRHHAYSGPKTHSGVSCAQGLLHFRIHCAFILCHAELSLVRPWFDRFLKKRREAEIAALALR